MAKSPASDVQSKALQRVKDYFNDAARLTTVRRTDLTRVYKSYATFIEPKQNNWSAAFKVNKAHEVVEKILPRVIAKNPRWIVSGRSDGVNPEYAQGIQDYLTYIWDEYNLVEPARLWAKNMIIYGKGYAKVKYKYETAVVLRDEESEQLDETGQPMLDELGQPILEHKQRKEEVVIGEHPTIDVKSWTDVYYDPRYILMADRPAFVEIMEGVRFADLLRNKDKYFNLDKVEQLGSLDKRTMNIEDYKSRIQAIAGISDVTNLDTIDLGALTLKIYYGYFNTTDKPINEKLYKICTVGDLLIIGFEEISQIPFEEIKCFEDPETANAWGFVEPIIGLQDELNFSKNSASEYINKALTRQVIWSPNSGIDPRDINNPVVPTTKDATTAINNFVELGHREINSSYFTKENDIERQVQAMTFTVDTSNPRSEQALTNTATGIRIKFFESNSVIDEVRKHFEQGLQRLAYKLLQSTFENMEENIVFKKMGKEGYWEMNKELLRDAITKYSIKVEVNSSSFDDIESRREDALAFFNLAQSAAAAGVQVNLVEAFKEVLNTFEKKDVNKFIQPPNLQELAAPITSAPGFGSRAVPVEQPALPTTPAARLTEAIAGGGLTKQV